MRRITPLVWIVSLVIALPLGGILLFPEVVHCLAISSNKDFRPVVSKNGLLYISRQTSARQQQRVLANDQEASHRIRTFWGQKQGGAILIYCHSTDQYAQYCGSGSAESSAGCSLGMPWGNSYLIIGPDGNNADVIAHERCHDELLARVGWWQIRRQIPQWFNEGLALMVDYRFTNPHADSLQRARDFRDEWEYRAYGRQIALSLTELETMRGFFGGDYHHVMLAYYTGAAEVSRWLAQAGQKAPRILARRVGAGDSFADVYSALVPAQPTSAGPR